jgi:hypothetical protein
MPFERVEFSLPDPDTENSLEIEVEPSSAIFMGEPSDAAGDLAEHTTPPQEDEDIDIEVVDDTPKPDRGRRASDPPEAVTDEELADYSEKVKNRIKHFSKGYHDERRAKELALREQQELERYTQQLIAENRDLKGTVGKNQTALLGQAKQSVASELEQAKKSYKDAYESGDSEAVLNAQEALTNAKIKADRLEAIRIPALQDEDTAVDTASNTETIAPAPVDERAAQWAKSNTWFGTDDEMTSFALGLHNKLVKSGVDPQSDDYYDALNARMREVFPNDFDYVSEDIKHSDNKRATRRPANVVAPATRSTAPKKVTLTQTQVNLAKRLGVPLKDYATQVALEMRKSNG